MGKWTRDAYYYNQGAAYEANMQKVAQAIKALRAQGYTARQNVTSSRSDAPIKMDEISARDPHSKGQIYFSRSDSNHALEFGDLFISFGSIGHGPISEWIPVGQAAAAAFRAAGLDATWHGRPGESVFVHLWRTPAEQAEFERDGILLPDCD